MLPPSFDLLLLQRSSPSAQRITRRRLCPRKRVASGAQEQPFGAIVRTKKCLLGQLVNLSIRNRLVTALASYSSTTNRRPSMADEIAAVSTAAPATSDTGITPCSS